MVLFKDFDLLQAGYYFTKIKFQKLLAIKSESSNVKHCF